MFSKIRNILDSYIDDYKIPGNDLAIYRNGECVFREQRGYSDYEHSKKMNGSERFNLYSCSKIITCTSAMKLYESGAFKLDDPLYLYMPEFKEMTVMTDEKAIAISEPIRIKHLFTMTAGFDYNTECDEIKSAANATNGRAPTREVMRHLAKRPLSFEPGSKWQYSLCHDVLAAFVETVSGVRFGEYVRKNIFEPAGMKRSTYNLADCELDSLMAQYRFDKDTEEFLNVGNKIIRFKLGDDYESGGAGCVSCTDDFANFLNALTSGKIIDLKTLELMSQNHLTEPQKRSFHEFVPDLKDFGYGLGIWCRGGEGNKNSFGGTGAAGSAYYVNPNLNYSMFYAQQVFSTPNSKEWKLIVNELDEIFK